MFQDIIIKELDQLSIGRSREVEIRDDDGHTTSWITLCFTLTKLDRGHCKINDIVAHREFNLEPETYFSDDYMIYDYISDNVIKDVMLSSTEKLSSFIKNIN